MHLLEMLLLFLLKELAIFKRWFSIRRYRSCSNYCQRIIIGFASFPFRHLVPLFICFTPNFCLCLSFRNKKFWMNLLRNKKLDQTKIIASIKMFDVKSLKTNRFVVCRPVNDKICITSIYSSVLIAKDDLYLNGYWKASKFYGVLSWLMQ